MSNIQLALATTLIPHIQFLEPGAAEVAMTPLPNLDMSPRDYLRNADAAFKRDGDEDARLIEAFTNLKRAMDSQISVVLQCFNLDGIKRLKSVPARLDFLQRCGFCSGDGFKKLNEIRNRIEHDFTVPTVADPGLYRDLVTAFVHACEGVTIFARHTHIELVFPSSRYEMQTGSIKELIEDALSTSDARDPIQGIDVRYDLEDRAIVFWGRLGGEEFEYRATPDDWGDFEFFMRVMYGFYEFTMFGDRVSLMNRAIPAADDPGNRSSA